MSFDGELPTAGSTTGSAAAGPTHVGDVIPVQQQRGGGAHSASSTSSPSASSRGGGGGGAGGVSPLRVPSPAAEADAGDE